MDIAAIKAELTAKHGPGVRVVTISDGRVFGFKPATAADWRRWKAAMMGLAAGKDAAAAAANEFAARALCVYPGVAEFDALRDEAPHIADAIGASLIDKVGGALEVDLGEV